MKPSFLKSYGFSLSLLAAMLVGSLLGLTFGERVRVIKPLGDIFLNLFLPSWCPWSFSRSLPRSPGCRIPAAWARSWGS